jgi:undecaprenyl pyrophosphate phosphatase UppP
MAMNAVVGTILRPLSFGREPTRQEKDTTWTFVYVCIPIVVIGAPIGTNISSMIISRVTIARRIYLLDITQFAVGLAVIRPRDTPNGLLAYA